MENKRDFYFDNAKFILILLVVFGHFIQPFIHENEIILTVYQFIYSFHMPAFILIGGYFSKGFTKPGYVKKISKKLLIPYLFFQLIYTFYYYYLYSGKELLFEPLNPHWSLWFLLSLFCWNLLLYPFTKIRPKLAVFVALFLGVLAGYLPFIGNYLSLSRTLVFFPVFLLGFFLKKEHFMYLKRRSIGLISGVCLLVIFLTLFILPDFNIGWLLGSKTYDNLHMENIGGLIRLGFYSLCFITTFSFLSLIPSKQYFFTNWGTRTLYVYLLHGFVIKYFRESDMVRYLETPGAMILLIFATCVLTLLLSSNVIRAISQPLIELRISLLKRTVNSLFDVK